jgi:hypothetical protein
MPGRQRIDLPIRHGRVGTTYPLLQHERVSDVRDKEQVCAQPERAANHAMGGRSDLGEDERAGEGKSREDEKAERVGRTSIRDDETGNGERIFSDERNKESGSRDELDGVGI